jgi:hypothetical protein
MAFPKGLLAVRRLHLQSYAPDGMVFHYCSVAGWICLLRAQ